MRRKVGILRSLSVAVVACASVLASPLDAGATPVTTDDSSPTSSSSTTTTTVAPTTTLPGTSFDPIYTPAGAGLGAVAIRYDETLDVLAVRPLEYEDCEWIFEGGMPMPDYGVTVGQDGS